MSTRTRASATAPCAALVVTAALCALTCATPTGPTPLGLACTADAECQTGFCRDGVCCESDCKEPCRVCNATGRLGRCNTAPVDTPCATPTCQAGLLQGAASCDGTGACIQSPTPRSCGGFACAADGKTCKARCDGPADCSGTAVCQNGVCLDNLPLGSPCGTNPAVCANKQCTDGVCCEAKDCGACKVCGAKGKCESRPQGPAPTGHCPGSAACKPDLCDGKGACDYAPTTTVCEATCGTGTVSQRFCQTNGSCATTPQETSCAFARCTGSGTTAACLSGCVTHADCISGSACDRSNAHVSGKGQCLDPSSITLVSGELASAVNAATAAKPVLFVPAGNHTQTVTVQNKPFALKLIGQSASSVIVDPSANNAPGLLMQDGTNVLVQGLTLQGATGTDGDGIRCFAATPATLTVIESVIQDNKEQGIDASNCQVTVRRSLVQTNQGGGIKTSDGTLVLTDSLIVNNGTDGDTGSLFGGITTNPTSATLTHLTIFNNSAKTNAAGGIVCASPLTLTNSILWANDGAQYAICTVKSSITQGSSSGGNIDKDPLLDTTFMPKTGSPCIDKGDDQAAGVTKLDYASTARLKGSHVDIGALEAP